LSDDKGISAAVGLYLLAIERLTQRQERAATKELATFLEVSQSTVTEYLKRLAEKGLIDYEWRAGCALTLEGKSLVEAMLRRQRLLKTFMVRELNYPLADVYQESLLIQHSVSNRFADALDQFLGFPTLDPHGEVIPRPNREELPPAYQPLTESAEGEVVQVCYLPDWQPTQLNYLCEMGIVPGATLRVVRVPPLNEPILLELDGEAIALSNEIGHWVGVCPCQKD
jgi:DtxR family Mn-dependent transcriptional regulator